MKKALFFLIKLILTVACLAWALNGVDWKDSILARPADLDWRWIVGGMGLAGLTIILTAVRLWVLLAAQGIRISFWRANELTLIGNLFNLVAVGGVGGDAARIFLLIRDHPERKLAVTLTVMFDHLVGLAAMSLVFFALTAGHFDALGSQSVETKFIMRFAWMFFGGGLALIVFMFLAAYPPIHDRIHARGKEWKIAFMRQVPILVDLYRKEWKYALIALVAAVVMLPIYYGSFWFGAKAAGSQVEPGPVLISMPVVDMMAAMPLSVAGVGVREKVFETLMSDLTGMDPAIAVASSLIGFFCTLVWAILGGLLFLRPSDRVSVKEMGELAGGEDGDQ
ncbi:lysylphosphatidylglycerol synthase transmembrane domain-containing protein [Haloferula sp.]|uniref:lysylphosphatidylglycerol synthase transmembrane domain-containing protein n=1 Tax=Haloferula sp. TaxID=2497595 RepID=UPI003C791FBC